MSTKVTVLLSTLNNMQTTLPARLRTVMDEFDLNQTQLGAAAGVSRAAVSKWMTESSQPDLDSLRKLSRKLQISLEWLETGRGSMVEEEADLDAYGGDEAAALDRARLELIRAAADAPKEAIDRARVALGLPPMDVPAHSGPIAPMDRRVSPGSIKPIGSDRPETGRD